MANARALSRVVILEGSHRQALESWQFRPSGVSRITRSRTITACARVVAGVHRLLKRAEERRGLLLDAETG